MEEVENESDDSKGGEETLPAPRSKRAKKGSRPKVPKHLGFLSLTKQVGDSDYENEEEKLSSEDESEEDFGESKRSKSKGGRASGAGSRAKRSKKGLGEDKVIESRNPYVPLNLGFSSKIAQKAQSFQGQKEDFPAVLL